MLDQRISCYHVDWLWGRAQLWRRQRYIINGVPFKMVEASKHRVIQPLELIILRLGRHMNTNTSPAHRHHPASKLSTHSFDDEEGIYIYRVFQKVPPKYSGKAIFGIWSSTYIHPSIICRINLLSLKYFAKTGACWIALTPFEDDSRHELWWGERSSETFNQILLLGLKIVR